MNPQPIKGNWKSFLNEISMVEKCDITYNCTQVAGMGSFNMFKCRCTLRSINGVIETISERFYQKIEAEQESAFLMIKQIHPELIKGETSIYLPYTQTTHSLIPVNSISSPKITSTNHVQNPRFREDQLVIPKERPESPKLVKIFNKSKIQSNEIKGKIASFIINITDGWYQEFYVTARYQIIIGDLVEDINEEIMFKDEDNMQYKLILDESQRDKLKEGICKGEDLIDICTQIYGEQTYHKHMKHGYKSNIPNTSYYVNEKNMKASEIDYGLTPGSIGLLYLIN